MANPFGTEEMAAGYATCRPAVHPQVMERVCRQMGRTERFAVALDVGCGAGVSTKALAGLAGRSVGLEPMESMLHRASAIAPFARFAAGRAEAIPLRDHSVDLITAAGSLNYVDLDLFFPEAARVLTQEGVLVIYDFSPGRSFRDATTLDGWFVDFCRRYPAPEHEARYLSPEILGRICSGFAVRGSEQFEIGLAMAPSFYVDYMMTETNVATAVRSGRSRSEIQSWCSESLASIWSGTEREVVFRGYFAWMSVV